MSQSRIVVTGSNGQLGQRLISRIQEENLDVVGVDLPDLDITCHDETRAFLCDASPGCVINCAAMTNVDGCELQTDLATGVNADAVTSLAAICDELDATLVQISTDFVFAGDASKPYTEKDEVGPRGAYAITKWKGEEAARKCRKHLVVRTAWLYGADRGNFVTAILERARTGQSLRVVQDEVGSPSFAKDVAFGIVELIKADAHGTVHVANAGRVSRFDMANAIVQLAGLKAELTPVTAREYGAPSPRPAFSVLDCSMYESLTNKRMRDWKEALAEFIEELS